MASANDDAQIAKILSDYQEALAGNIWRVQGNAVIYHRTLERIAAKAKIIWGQPQVLLAERDAAAILVTGEREGRTEWSIGEADVAKNYRVSGKQAAYVYAMAEKRAKDRVILKLINLHGLVYSEAEADEFAETSPTSTASTQSSRPSSSQTEASRQRVESGGGRGAREYMDEDRRDERTAREVAGDPAERKRNIKTILDRADFERRVRAIQTPAVLIDFMEDGNVRDWLFSLHPRVEEECIAFARERLKAIRQ